MSYAHYIKEIGRGATGSRALARDEAHALYGAILDGGVPDLELGAIVLAMRIKGESLGEMQGFLQAADERSYALHSPPGRPRPIILPSYNGSRREANLTPLLALLLQHFGVPVIVHGLIEGYGRVTSAQIFRELGVMPGSTLAQAQAALNEHDLAFVPLPLLSPGLANLLALRGRMGVRNSAHSLVKLLDPCKGQGVVIAAATHPPFIDLMRSLILERGHCGLLLRATEGEPFANPKRRPRIEHLCAGQSEVLFEAERESLKSLPNLPAEADAAATAQWIRAVIDKKLPLPQPIANQLACCLFASGYADDFNQAKAIVAVEGNFSGHH